MIDMECKLTVSGVPGASSSSESFAFFDCFNAALGSSVLFLLSPGLETGLLKQKIKIETRFI